MLRMILSLTALSLFAIQPAVARPLAPGCNPAVQNWNNGSGDTCPYVSNSGVVIVERAAPPAPPPPDRTTDEETVE
jgi:hypothetical protein